MENLNTLFNGLTINPNYLFMAVVVGMIVDIATGIAKAYKAEGKPNSSKLRDGGFKKGGIIAIVGLGFGLSFIFNDTNQIIADAVCAYYVYTELVSILENLDAMGVPLPPILLKIIKPKEAKKDVKQ